MYRQLGNSVAVPVVSAIARQLKNYLEEASLCPLTSKLLPKSLPETPSRKASKQNVSLRERWKQADLEASALKFVHRRAEAYVLSLSESEINSRRKDSNSYIAIDAFILASSAELDELLKNLKSRIEIQESETIDIVSHAQRCRIDKELINSKYGLWL